jgi:hypothetical protein
MRSLAKLTRPQREVVCFAVLIVLLSAGCGQSSAAPGTVAANPPSGSLSSASLIVGATLVPAPDPSQFGLPDNAQWEDVVIRTTDAAERAAAEWEGNLIAQSDRIASANSGGPVVGGVTFSEDNGAGNPLFLRASPFESADPLPAGPNVQLTESDIASRVDSWAQSAGVSVLSITYESHPPVGLSPIVVAQIGGDTTQFVGAHPNAALEVDMSGAPIFVELVDSSGSPVEAVGAVPMSGATEVWHDPSVVGCLLVSCATQPDSTTN